MHFERMDRLLKQKQSFNTQVHVELLLPGHFEKHELHCLGHYKYIGCRRPACYLCHTYIKGHGA